MTVAYTALASAIDATDSTSYNTASVSPSANALILLAVLSTRNDSVNASPPSSVTGNGLTWVQVATIAFDVSAGIRSTLTIFRAMGASPSSGAITINFAATHHNIIYSVVEFTGVDTGGTNGSAAVVQSATNTASGTNTVTATLAAFGSANNATYGAFGVNVSSGWTPGTGFTEIHDTRQTDTLDTSLGVNFRNDNDTTVDATSGGSGDLGVIGIEIKAAPAGTTIDLTTASLNNTTNGSQNSANANASAASLLMQGHDAQTRLSLESGTAALNLAGSPVQPTSSAGLGSANLVLSPLASSISAALGLTGAAMGFSGQAVSVFAAQIIDLTAAAFSFVTQSIQNLFSVNPGTALIGFSPAAISQGLSSSLSAPSVAFTAAPLTVVISSPPIFVPVGAGGGYAGAPYASSGYAQLSEVASLRVKAALAFSARGATGSIVSRGAVVAGSELSAQIVMKKRTASFAVKNYSATFKQD